jgi:hypothetical protein
VVDSGDSCEATDDESEAIEPTAPASDKKGETSSGGWTPWGYKKLMKLVADAKGAVSKQVVRFVKKQYVHVKTSEAHPSGHGANLATV